MKILSWDVGIKNLAFCMIESIDSSWNIVDWGIVNLIEDKDYYCNVCNKKGSIYLPYTNKYYCKVHSKKVDIEKPDIKDTENKCNHLIKGKECNRKGYKCVKLEKSHNLCKTHYKQYEKKINSYYNLNTVKKNTTSNYNIDDLVYNLITKLDNKPELLDCSNVVIENQPSLKNPKMKNISSCLYSYFYIRGKIDKNIKNVSFMSPSNKIKLTGDKYKQENLEIVKLKGDEAKSYKLTKSLAVKYSKDLIENTKWISIFNSHKKKDDLADALLQGLYYLKYIIKS